MPNLQQLVDEIAELDVDLSEIKLSGRFYDSLISQADDLADMEEPTE
ncbi:hypothetical protein ACFLW0_02550 [Chloroflexota bacterium]